MRVIKYVHVYVCFNVCLDIDYTCMGVLMYAFLDVCVFNVCVHVIVHLYAFVFLNLESQC